MWDEWVIAAERVVFPNATAPGWVHVRDGVIAATGSVGDPMPDCRLHYVGQAVVLPGLVDTHVHTHEPDGADWEGFESATRAAAAGGTTTIVDMSHTSVPVTSTPDAFDKKWKAAEERASVDVGFWGGVVWGGLDDLKRLAPRGVCGFTAFGAPSGTDGNGWLDRDSLEAAAAECAGLQLPLVVHAGDSVLLEGPGRGFESLAPSERRTYRSYLDSRPHDAEDAGIAAVIEVARKTGAAVHIAHVASGASVTQIAEARREGVQITAETCPHYLMFSAEDIADGTATLFKCVPPIREERHRLELWQGLIDGTISMVVSDHTPVPPELKAMDTGDLAAAHAGISSLELRLPVVWTAGQSFSIRLEDLAMWLAAAPADLAGFGHRKGRLDAGYDADIVVFDPNAQWKVDATQLQHRHPITAYEGVNLQGRVTATFLAGCPTFGEDSGSHESEGRRLRR